MKQTKRSCIALATTVALAMGACSTKASTSGAPKQPTTVPTRATKATATNIGDIVAKGPSPRLFNVSLSEGALLNAPATASSASFSKGGDLDPGRVGELVSKLPKWNDPTANTTPFWWPIQSTPLPRTGETVQESFPPSNANAQPPAVDNGPLKVLRVQPEGDVPIAPYVAVTFNQPMVPVGTVGQVAAADAPVKLSPDVPGKWQWIGTRTLRFDVDATSKVDRLPMATTFTATVPAGTKSATGSLLAAAATFTFTTPPPVVESLSPMNGNLNLQPIFVASFDQRVDPAAVLKTTNFTVNSASTPLRLATKAEIESDETARNESAAAKEGRFVAFRPVDKLPTSAALKIEFATGTSSAEGPNTTVKAQIYSGRTYGPLEVAAISCGQGDNCPPGSGFYLEFTNPIDPNATGSKDANVEIAPKLEGTIVRLDGIVSIIGATKARTTYTVTIPASLTDVFGQTLGKAVTKTFTVGPAGESLRQLSEITTLDPFSGAQKLSVLTTNKAVLRVRVFQADPSKFAEYRDYYERRGDPGVKMPAWRLLSDSKVQPKSNKDTTVETELDLSPQLHNQPGQVIVLVDPVPELTPNADNYYENQSILTWVQSTHMALDGFASGDTGRFWATDLRTGAPLANLTVSSSKGPTAKTNSDGVATLPLPQVDDRPPYYFATNGGETFILQANFYPTTQTPTLRWYVFDDRQIYRPGETVNIKGWVRIVDTNTSALTISSVRKATYEVNDANGVELAKGTVDIGPLGGFNLAVPIPATANVGPANLQITPSEGADARSDNSPGDHSFQIAEFRRPEFEVKVDPAVAGPFVSTAPVTMTAKASYYAGGPLPNAPVEWSVSTSETTFSPVGWDDFTFGMFVPWWMNERSDVNSFESDSPALYKRGSPLGDPQTKTYKGTTNGDGLQALQLDFSGERGVLPDLPVSVNVSGTVTDVNRQAWADQKSIIVHSADRYVGLRSDRSFVKQGDPLNVEAVVTDIDGKPLGGSSLVLTAGRLRTDYTSGKTIETIIDPQTCKTDSSAEPKTNLSKCVFKTPVGGEYRITTTVTDAKGGRNRTELSVWVSGAEVLPARTVEQQQLTLVPDKKEYAAGDTAKVLVQAPFANGEGMVVVTHGTGVRETIRFTAKDGSSEVAIPITDGDVPDVGLSIEVVGSASRAGLDGAKVAGAPPRPAYAVGELRLSVPPRQRTLQVAATPAASELEPGGKTSIAVSVNDAQGKPVQGAELAVVVVDEAVLGLTDYKLLNPIDFFYPKANGAVSTAFGRDEVRLLDPASLVVQPVRQRVVDAVSQASGGAMNMDAAAPETTAAAAAATTAPLAKRAAASDKPSPDASSAAGALQIRSNFDALALFQPDVRTDSNGKASVEVTVPDNLTRYRIMVVATSGADRFGTAESNLTARLPLSVRPSAPRFLNTGDVFELPVVLQNLSKAAMDVEVVVQTANLDLTGSAGHTVKVPAGDRVEVRFPAKVRSAGVARLRVSAFGKSDSGTDSDSTEISIPVFTPATAEAFATYGTIDSGAIKVPMVAPKGVIDSVGGLDISTSSTSLQALTDALLYVDKYDYQSSDAYASRIMSISALRGVLADFKTEGLPSEAELNAAVERDIAGLVGLQNGDGGWSYWRRYDRTEPFNTVQAMHALILAKQAGYQISPAALARGTDVLANIEQYIPENYGSESRDTIRAYALWVRALSGQRDPGKAAKLFAERGESLNLDALSWIWGSIDSPTVSAQILRTITNRAVDTAGAITFTNSYADGDYVTLGSDRRTDALVLDSLIANAPKSDMVDKVVAGLLAGKTKGRWNNAQENTFALLAFKHYYDTYESATPNFVAQAWVGDQFAGQHTFQGRTTERSNIDVPMKALVDGVNRDIVVAKDGTGRLYYRIGLRYVPANLTLDALDRGFVVNRVYEPVDTASDVTRDASGVWHIKAGAKVRVKLTMVAESQRTHVALIDPLPAGLEALNPMLAVTQPVDPNAAAPDTVAGDTGIIGGGIVGGGIAGGGIVSGETQSWWWGNWWDFQQFRDDRSEAYSTDLAAGVYTYNYIARATTPGTFIVPPTRAEEMYSPETFGRTATDKVVVN